MENEVIVSDNGNNNKSVSMEKTAIVMALYYEDDVDKYLTYLSAIPENIYVFIVSSNQSILEKAIQMKVRYSNLNVIKKDNRGRDLSALLVAFRDYINDFDYLCFLHDKKSKHVSMDDDLSLWIENLWGNMICSTTYIKKVISILRDEGYGVLLPPKPVGIHSDSMYADPWDNDFDNVIQLAKEIHIDMPIRREDREMVSLGSVFWCQTKALEKLFTHNWKYTDFPEEPMPDDGTISHAIERIFGFAAVDAGYKVKTIMNPQYAAKVITILQDKLQFTYDWLWKKEGIKNTYQLSKYQEEKVILARIFKEKEVYLYGAGDYGIQYLQKLLIQGYKPKAFVVSDGQKKNRSIHDLPVKELSEIEDITDVWFIITTNPALQESLALNLEKKGIKNYYKAVCI